MSAAGAVMRVREVVLWWAGLSGLWLLTVSTPAIPEIIAAVAAGLCCAVLAATCRAALGGRWRFRLRWLAWLLPLAWEVGTDWVRLRPGQTSERFTKIEVPPQASPGLTAARRVAAMLVLASSPSTVLVDELPDAIVVHPLPQGHDLVRRAVQR